MLFVVAKYEDWSKLFSHDVTEENLSSLYEALTTERQELFEAVFDIGNVNLLQEGSFSLSKLVDDIFTAIVRAIKSMCDKFVNNVYGTIASVESYINRYRHKIEGLTDNDLKGIMYEYRNYYFPKNIPIEVPLGNVEKYINKINDWHLTHDDVDNLKSNFDTELGMMRAKMIGVNNEVSSDDFQNRVRKIFRGGQDVSFRHLTKDALMQIMYDLDNHRKLKSDIEAIKTRLVDNVMRFVNITRKLNFTYAPGPNKNVVITLPNGLTFESENLSVITIYKEYRDTINRLLVELANSYTLVYNEYLLAAKDKFYMDYVVLKQILALVH